MSPYLIHSGRLLGISLFFISLQVDDGRVLRGIYGWRFMAQGQQRLNDTAVHMYAVSGKGRAAAPYAGISRESSLSERPPISIPTEYLPRPVHRKEQNHSLSSSSDQSSHQPVDPGTSGRRNNLDALRSCLYPSRSRSGGAS
jgi:hypothetical protein